jgi:deoxyadenosine/deoxycytidine kinase
LIVEFIGSTGSGKSTLINDVQHRLAKSRQVTTSSDLVTGLVGLQGINNVTARNLVQEFVGLPYFLRSFKKYKDFISFSIRTFSRNSSFSVKTINNLRSIERKLSGYEIFKHYTHDLIILVDEGPILTAHMFAYNDSNISQLEIEKFVSLLPLPDLIIYIQAPVETLLERSMNRSNPPREMNSRNRSENEQYIKRAVSIFDRITKNGNIHPRLLTVDNSDCNEQDFITTLDRITNFILKSEYGKN